MAENATAQADPQAASPGHPGAGAGAKSLAGMVLAAAFMGAVIVVEIVAAWLLFPSAEDIVERAKLEIERTAPRSNDPVDQIAPEVEDAKPAVEVDLGNFSVTAFQPASNVTLRIDFQLYGAVLDSDESEFTALFASRQQRFREQVIVIIRKAEQSDLIDPRLGLIKRKILEKTNALLGKPLLQSVVFSDFSFVEQ